MVILIGIVLSVVIASALYGTAGYYEYQRRQPTDWSKEPVVPWS